MLTGLALRADPENDTDASHLGTRVRQRLPAGPGTVTRGWEGTAGRLAPTAARAAAAVQAFFSLLKLRFICESYLKARFIQGARSSNCQTWLAEAGCADSGGWSWSSMRHRLNSSAPITRQKPNANEKSLLFSQEIESSTWIPLAL